MTDIQREEMISAYIDGELSPEERARVDGWLAESPELRQLHDDLQALRAGMQSLPRHKLERDLSGSVIRRAAPVVARATGGDSSISKVVPGSASLWERGSHLRRVMWPALAVAAALAILVYDANTRPDEQQVALAPREADGELESSSSDNFAVDSNIGAAPEPQSPALGRDERTQSRVPLAAEPAPPGAPASPPPASADRDARSRPMDFAQRSPQVTDNRSGAESLSRGSTPNMQAVPQATEDRKKPIPYFSKSAAGAKADAQAVIEYAVSPEYFQGKEFEKLLDSNGITWTELKLPAEPRVEQPQAQASEAAKSALSAGRQAMQQQSLYLLEAPSDKVQGVLSQVPESAVLKQQKQVTLPRFTVPQTKPEGEAQAGVKVLLVAPLQAEPAAVPKQSPPPAKPSR